MAVRQKGNKWQVDVTVGGVRAPRVSCTTKHQAQLIEQEFISKLRLGHNPETLVDVHKARKADAGTLDDLVTITYRSRWSGTKGADTALRNAADWTRELGTDLPVSTLNPAMVADVVDGWAAKGAANGTINRKLAALSVMLRVAEERGLIEKRFRLPRRKEYEGRLRYYTDEEVDSLIDFVKAEPDMANLFVVAVETGMRLGEILGLTPRDLDWKHEMINLGATKGNSRRSLPMTKPARLALDALSRGKMSHEPLFGAHVNSRQISRVIVAWKLSRGLPKEDEACFHAFRHTTCSRLMQRGVPINVVQKWMGHTRIETTMRYSHLAPESLGLAKAALEGN